MLFALTAAQVSAVDLVAGEAKAKACIGCHGKDGVSTSPRWPKLAGQHQAYLLQQMLAFKAGERRDPIMRAIMGAFSDRDIENMAAYFAALKAR
jgi:cytochrome c553